MNPVRLKGVVIDDWQARKTGEWVLGTGLKGFIGSGYVYARGDASIKYHFAAPGTGDHEVRIAYRPHQNRGRRVPVQLQIGDRVHDARIDMTQEPAGEHGFVSLGKFEMSKDEQGVVTIATDGAEGVVHADAVQILPANP